MDKKVLAGILEGIVTQVATNNDVEPIVARALVGSLILKIKDQIANACVTPTLNLASEAPTVAS